MPDVKDLSRKTRNKLEAYVNSTAEFSRAIRMGTLAEIGAARKAMDKAEVALVRRLSYLETSLNARRLAKLDAPAPRHTP